MYVRESERETATSTNLIPFNYLFCCCTNRVFYQLMQDLKNDRKKKYNSFHVHCAFEIVHKFIERSQKYRNSQRSSIFS